MVPPIETTPKNLDTVIAIDDAYYTVNSAHADEASKVANALKIQSYDIDGNPRQPIDFDGSKGIQLSVLDAETGGTVRGPIAIPEIFDALGDAEGTLGSENLYKYKDYVLNYKDIVRLITAKAGAGYFTWGNHTFSWGEQSFVQMQSAGLPVRAGIVLGTAAELADFAAENYIKKHLQVYLYIATDNNGLYYGTADNSTYSEIASDTKNIVEVAKKANMLYLDDGIGGKGYTAADIFSLDKKVDWLAELAKLATDSTGKVTSLADSVDAATTALSKVYWPSNDDITKPAGCKTITISTADPAANQGVVGDIWIKYSTNS